MFVDPDDGGAFSDGIELCLGQAIDSAEHCSKEFQFPAMAIGVDAVNRLCDELAARGEHQFLFGAAQENVHALRVPDESKRARPDERIVPDEACDHDIRLATLEAVARVDEFPVLPWAIKAEQGAG
ncbi:MAG TPA: hypothetical protein VIP11_22100, partial [Gemmatimonadaceae bacterium]